MSEQSSSSPEIVTDEQLAGFVRDAKAMRDAESCLHAGVADVLARPFDRSAQDQLRELLDSPQLQQATQIARQFGGEL